MMKAHRLEVKSGEFTSGVREGIDDATHEALNTCMQQEDEAEENTAKTKDELAANEEARQERAEKVHAFASKPSGSGARKKRKADGSGSTSSTSNPFSDEDEESPTAKRRSAPATVTLEDLADSIATYFANQVECDDTKERKLAIAESAAKSAEKQADASKANSQAMLKLMSSQIDDPDEKAKRLAVADKEADAKINKSKALMADANNRAEEIKIKAAESKANQEFFLQMMAVMGKLVDKLS